MTELVSDEQAVISSRTTTIKEKIVPRKTIVYKTLVDPAVMKISGERIKTQLFARFGFLEPKPDEVQLVSIDKYYEIYMLIGGKYFIDYYRKRNYRVKVEKTVFEVRILRHKFTPEKAQGASPNDPNVLELIGEERLAKKVEASYILDRHGARTSLDELPSAPSEKRPKKILTKFGLEEIASGHDLMIIRKKLCKRPKDCNRIVTELFEVSERITIYTPRFKIRFKNLKTGEEKTTDFDGVTAKRIK